MDDPAQETSTTTRPNTKQDTPVRNVRINPTAQYRTIRTRTAAGSRERKPESIRDAGAGARTKYSRTHPAPTGELQSDLRKAKNKGVMIRDTPPRILKRELHPSKVKSISQ